MIWRNKERSNKEQAVGGRPHDMPRPSPPSVGAEAPSAAEYTIT